jgi:hypothetical protein
VTGYSDVIGMTVTVISLAAATGSGFSAYKDFTTPFSVEGSAKYTQPVTKGQTVMLNWIFSVRTECEGQYASVWRGDKGYMLSEEFRPMAIPFGENQNIVIPTVIPTTAPEGILTMTVRGYTDCDKEKSAVDNSRWNIKPVLFLVVKS